MKRIQIVTALIFIIIVTHGCYKERYRKDKTNKMTKKAQKASKYLSIQAEVVTNDNLEKRPERAKKSQKRMEKMQKDLNEINNKTSKVKKPKKHSGEFKLY